MAAKDIQPININFFQLKQWEAEISVSKSNSKSFGEVLSILKSLQTYKEYYDNDLVRDVFTATFYEENIKKFLKAYYFCKNWKTTKIKVCGQNLRNKELAGVNCACLKKESPFFNDYCFGGERSWGKATLCCFHAGLWDYTGLNSWYNRYNFVYKGQVFMDKKRILKDVICNLRKYRFCPYFNAPKIYDGIMALPDKITNNKDFEIIEFLGNTKAIIRRRDEEPFFTGTGVTISLSEENSKEYGLFDGIIVLIWITIKWTGIAIFFILKNLYHWLKTFIIFLYRKYKEFKKSQDR
ncbi:MAG: hypothetical protein ACI37O_01680 [Candidatus Avelusimicrobium sp.]|uniref:hypothetical protein n=1 Tax=Candidatus Avelusimicrobium sp. TaxID=3048833 RepID=UPI003F042254